MVCGGCGVAGNFRYSHIVAFLWKVMVVRDTSVFMPFPYTSSSLSSD
jgi:hypothetical protein